MLYPLKLEPIYKSYIWGGNNLSAFGRKLPYEKVAESWELTCNSDDMSIVSNGYLIGNTLGKLINVYKHDLIGSKVSMHDKFPLLIKILDANSNLSVQVHPDDNYARKIEGQTYGKNEMWYIVKAKKGAKIVHHLLNGVTKESLKHSIESNEIEKCLNYVDVCSGDIINIPEGTVHAMGSGIIAVEIQQNSNITYRIYDYNRKDMNGNKRPLHIDKALDIINFNHINLKSSPLNMFKNSEIEMISLFKNKYFTVELCNLNGIYTELSDTKRFYCFTIIEGKGEIYFNSGSFCFHEFETFMIPSSLGGYTLTGNFKALKSFITLSDEKIL